MVQNPTITHTQLKAFHAVAKTGGFTAAAKFLGLTQPAVTQQIKSLETQYGAELFKRVGKSVTLTSTGSLLLNLSDRYFNIAEEAHHLLTSIMQMKSGRLRIACDIAARAFPTTASFRNKYPDIKLSFSIEDQTTLETSLQDFLVDIAISGSPSSHDDLVSFPIAEEPLTFSVNKSHPLANYNEVISSEIGSNDIILVSDNPLEESIQKTILQHLKLTENTAQYYPNTDMVIEAAANNLGGTFLSRREIMHDKRLKSVRINDSDIKRREYLIMHRSKENTPLIEAFYQSLVSKD
ncbi:LysR family transcriptional regulator [Sneathiella sp. P13V-1]|uniref:LysR substrate-binding domain-containing protein n=1 Tax=Sneathiella sp. P13V-1 TaxID=2697366 RepID=UPI00187B518B|nr:LysR substrate-binding domain-containing protein [Sneathiella sp. P13V-1]MBE7636712.1 LysR family transcriptional regulator [Sneathiella sp. P13V-1]